MGIVFSQVFDIKELHHVKIVDHVPEGLPVPSLPRLDLVLYLWKDAISISIICYIFVFSMELYALGICQIISAFFPVYPSGASLSRSSLCEMTGAKTQLHALFSSSLLLIVILWLGRLLEPLPMAVLSCIVIVSLKSLFLQFKELPKLWKISVVDFAIWVVAFLATVFIDVTSGLIISVAFVILSVVVREQWPKFHKIYATPNKDIFRPAELYKDLVAVDEPVCTILRFEAPLHFANSSKFVDRCSEVMAEMCRSSPTAVKPMELNQ
uniref:SLC26A/SulP transporter domain-containing protein n=1 Tax=Ditylenchus dipsaci TaxID=166011 RepID=A0A915E772_9BILA